MPDNSKSVEFQGKQWRIQDTRTAEQVSSEHPDPRIGQIMEKEGLELLILSGGGETIDLLIARIHSPQSQTVAFRDSKGNILDPGSFPLS